jgi:hypothetical protein
MKRVLNVLLCGLLVGWAGMVSAEVLPADATNVREVHIFRNVSGSTQPSGTAYVLQDNSTDANVLVGNAFGAESSLGLDVTTTTTADLDDFVGIQIDDSVVDDGLVRLVTYGPAIVRWCGSSDNTNTRLADVGTCNGVAGRLGSGTLAGTLLSLSIGGTADTVGTTGGELNGTTDADLRWVWVQPQNN